MKPLDGRYEFDTQFQLINTIPYSYDNTITNGTNINVNEYLNGICKITSSENLFTSEDLNKSFCGLWLHDHTQTPIDYDYVDAFNPSGDATVYSKVVYVDPNGSFILVDFEYNGNDVKSPQPTINQKGYIFYDNTKPLNEALNDHMESGRKYFEFKSLILKSNYVIRCYVAPKLVPIHEEKSLTDTFFNLISKKTFRVKYGIEDYNHLNNALGISKDYIDIMLFVLGGGNKDFISVKGQWTPPHRILKSAETKKRNLLSGGYGRTGTTMFYELNNNSEWNAIKNGIGLTKEFYVMSHGNVGKSGTRKFNENPTLKDVDNFHFVYINKFDFRGRDAAGNNNGNGGLVIILDDGVVDFNPQNAFSSLYVESSFRITNDYSNTNNGLETKTYYPPMLEMIPETGNHREVLAGGSFLSWYLLQVKRKEFGNGGKYDNCPMIFMMAKHGHGNIARYWEFLYRPTEEFNLWGSVYNKPLKPGQNVISDYLEAESVFSKKALLNHMIPKVGEKYTISIDFNPSSEDYQYANEGAKIGKVGTKYRNQIMSHVPWSIIKQKYAQALNITEGLEYDYEKGKSAVENGGNWAEGYLHYGDLDTVEKKFVPYSDVPENGKPVAFQMGDIVKITTEGYENLEPFEVQTVVVPAGARHDGDFGKFLVQSPTTKRNGGIDDSQVWWQHNNYHQHQYFRYRLDRDLPIDLPDTFEIEIIKSVAEQCFSEDFQEGVLTYKGTNTGIAWGGNGAGRRSRGDGAGIISTNTYPIPGGFPSDAAGHLAYSQGGVTKIFRNIDFNNSFWRENDNNEGFVEAIPDWQGNLLNVRALGAESKGLTYINCTNPPVGEIGRNGNSPNNTSSMCGTGWERQRVIYEKYNFIPDWADKFGLQFPPKMRVYGTEGVVNTTPTNTTYAYEEYPDDSNAPDMPYVVEEYLTLLSE